MSRLTGIIGARAWCGGKVVPEHTINGEFGDVADSHIYPVRRLFGSLAKCHISCHRKQNKTMNIYIRSHSRKGPKFLLNLYVKRPEIAEMLTFPFG